jgi:hypothetical protein
MFAMGMVQSQLATIIQSTENLCRCHLPLCFQADFHRLCIVLLPVASVVSPGVLLEVKCMDTRFKTLVHVACCVSSFATLVEPDPLDQEPKSLPDWESVGACWVAAAELQV